MTAEQQLERSVLERKEREELRAIAQAMSLDTNSRSKKADIIDQILRAAGVEVSAGSANGGPAAPARTRGTSRNAASNGEAGAVELDGDSANGTGPGHEGANGSSVSPSLTSSRAGPQVATSSTSDESDETSGSSVQTSGDEASSERDDGGSSLDRPTSTPRQGGGQNQNRQHMQQGGQGANANEPGNRRGRRRRGRERTPGGGGGGERELQGGGQEAQYSGELIPVSGLLDLRDEGYGFLRAEGYLPSSKDVYISISQARRFAMRRGDFVEGACRPAASNEKFPALIRIDSVSGLAPEEARNRPRFEDLTPLFPDERLRLETTGSAELTTRIIDLLSPIGKGQRGMIVSPPRPGRRRS